VRVDIDPYSGFTLNLSTIRAEAKALMWIRDANSAVRIGA
jgi:hypothetical protein